MTKQIYNKQSSIGKGSDKHLRKIWENMIAGKCYIRGIIDSDSEQKVIACRKGNYFGPENCYFAYIQELPFGACYVDGE